MTLEEKSRLIINDIKKETGTNPVTVFRNIAKNDYVNIHGPEHHILDGASILVAFKNAGGEIELDEALEKLRNEGLKMPGAMCGLWGVCGAVTSVGSALAIIDNTGPLSKDGKWGEHMNFTSDAISRLAEINGPRCCKRDAMVAFSKAVEYINSHYDVKLEYEDIKCIYSSFNSDCLKDKCPFYK